MKLPFFKKKSFKEDATRESPILGEKAWSNDSFFNKNGPRFESWNEDELIGRKGFDIYNKMLLDPQVKAAFNLVIDIIISRNFRFQKIENDPIQNEIEDFFFFNINNSLKSSWTQALKTVLMSKAYGYSVSEKIYCVGNYLGSDKWLLGAIKGKPFESFRFVQDHFGNIINIIQDQGSVHKKLDPSKFIVYINSPEINPVYGQSDLRSAYRSFWEKDNILKFWNIYLERLAGGLLVAKPGEMAGSLTGNERNNFDNILKRVSQGTSIRMPSGWDLDVVHGPSTDAYQRAIEHRDKQIAKSLMVPNLLGFSEQGSTGSFAQAETQLDTFMHVITSEGDQLSEALNEQLFKELAFWNFGDVDFPKFKFEPFSTKQKREIADAWTNAVEKGTVANTFNDELRTRELLLYDSRDEDDAPDNIPEETTVEESEESPENTSVIGKDEDIEMAATNIPLPSPNKTDPLLPNGRNQNDPTLPTSHQTPRVTEQGSSVQSTPWRDRMDFIEISDQFENNESKMVEGMSVFIDIMFDEIVNTITTNIEEAPSPDSQSPDVADKNEADVVTGLAAIDNSISVETKSGLNQVIRKSLRRSYADGRKVSQETIDAALEDDTSMSVSMKSNIHLISRLSKSLAVKPKKDVEFNWTVLDFVEGLRLDTAEKYFAANAFTITGAISSDMTDKAKQIILDGIKNELSIDQIVGQLEDVLQPLIGKKDPETGEIDKSNRSRVETIARTNITDAFNQASLAVYTDPDLGDFVEAFEYTAILDSRTTDFCRSYDNRVFLKDDPIWESITPPNHFNCRSTIIPVTVLDDFDVSEKATNNEGDLVQPSNGFGTVEN